MTRSAAFPIQLEETFGLGQRASRNEIGAQLRLRRLSAKEVCHSSIIPGGFLLLERDLLKTSITQTSDEFALWVYYPAWCAPMMSKRVVAAVLIAALVLAGGGIITSLFL